MHKDGGRRLVSGGGGGVRVAGRGSSLKSRIVKKNVDEEKNPCVDSSQNKSQAFVRLISEALVPQCRRIQRPLELRDCGTAAAATVARDACRAALWNRRRIPSVSSDR